MALWDRERITLVIEQEAVRLMGVANGRVTRWGSAPLPRGLLDAEGLVSDEAAMAQVLERLWAAQTVGQPAPKERLLLAIPGHSVATTMVAVDGVDSANRALLHERARAALPQAEENYVSWQQVGPASRPVLFVVSARRAVVDGYARALERAGLGVAAVDVKPLALIRGVAARNAVIVDGERSQGTVIVVDDALPRRVRFQSLALPLLLSPEDKALRLAELLVHTLQQYNEEAQARALHPAVPIFLTGSLADHTLLHDVVRDVLRHPIGVVKPEVAVPPDMPLSQFLANLGLAQKQL